jgi:hypothetical protein
MRASDVAIAGTRWRRSTAMSTAVISAAAIIATVAEIGINQWRRWEGIAR